MSGAWRKSVTGSRRAALLLVLLVGALAVAGALAGAVAWIQAGPAPRHVAQVRPVHATPGRSLLPPHPVAVPLVTQGTDQSAPDVLFVGASYTAGLGASPATNGYAFQTAHDLGWRAQVDGVPGTGYLNPGPTGSETFGARIARLTLAVEPDVIVLQSGRNDVGYSRSLLAAAERAVIALCRSKWPSAHLIVLGAIPAHVPVGPGLLAVEATLHGTATAAGVGFIDPIAQSWITSANQRANAGPVPQHPGDAGYAYLGERLAASLKAILPTVATPSSATPTAATAPVVS